MKRKLPHPPLDATPRQWRSLAELENSPEFQAFLQREFPRGADVYEDSGLSKRDFLKLMGASLALAGVGGLAGCRRPEAYLVPFTKAAEWTIPGKFLYYATAMPLREGAMPLIVATVDGRPIKIEGNPLHPCSNGGTDGFAQASILDLYDPLRSKEVLENGQPSTWQAFSAWLAELAGSRPHGVAVLAERKNSPTRERLRSLLETTYPGLLWAEYEPLGASRQRKAIAACFGGPLRLIPKFERADVILALDDDFLHGGTDRGSAYAAGFFTRRNPDQRGAPMNRLYVVENHYTSTGGLADHRLRCKASLIGEAARRIAVRLAEALHSSTLAAAAAACPATEAPLDDAWLTACAEDLAAHAGRCLVLAGHQQPAWVQALVFAINDALGSFGSTILSLTTGERPAASIKDLADAIEAGQVQTLFILGGNPAYNAPADLQFAELLRRVPHVVRHGMLVDETSRLARWHIPAAHYLETWGDVTAFDGTYTAIQPMILPLWNGIPELDLLALLAGQPQPVGPRLIQETFALKTGARLAPPPPPDLPQTSPPTPFPAFLGAEANAAWNEFLRVGFLPNSAPAQVPPPFDPAAATVFLAQEARPAEGGLELVFLASSSVDDGRYASNSWLQETPDFETKVTWDNVALLSPATAKALGIRANNFDWIYKVAEKMGNEIDFDIVADVIEISAGGQSIEAAALVAPGHADDSISIALGYGRQGVAAIMDNVGFNAYPLRISSHPRFREGVQVRLTGKTYPLARTQESRSMYGRDLVREGTLERYTRDPAFAQTIGMDGHIPENFSLFTHPKLNAKEQWAMAIDLNLCFGCNACLVACQAENNVPVVGKEQVRKNRDMAWIRIDRYFAGDPENPEMLAQTILCQQCENAPCETVCPVNATVHSEDGLNLMAYNRCIGTRYCANNCPWKVRRFNFFDYNQRPLDKLYWGPLAPKGTAESLKLVKNPNVTVRMRGVMEKCTFCIQRIEEAKIARLVEAGPRNKDEVPIKEFKTACQQACPAGAIVFGDQNRPNSRIARLRAAERGYVMFKYLNVAPRVTYLARIKNPNMQMPGAELVGNINTPPHGHHDANHPPSPDPAAPHIGTGHNHGKPH